MSRTTKDPRMTMLRELLATRPHGISTDEAARLMGMHRSNAYDRFSKLAGSDEAVRVQWVGGEQRWVSPQHQRTAIEAAEVERFARRQRHEARLAALQAKPKGVVLTDGERMATVAYQPTVKEWPKAEKPGPNSVFDLGAA